MSSDVDTTINRRKRDDDEQDKKEIHRKIEENRRRIEGEHMEELRSLIPNWYKTSPTKFTQLVLLEMACDLLEQINSRDPSASLLPSYLTSDETHYLNLEASKTFLLITTIESTKFRIIYVNDSIHRVLHLSPNDWIERNLFELIHPDDLNAVYGQLSAIGRYIDDKPSFKCRVKQSDGSYTTVVLNGMIKKLDQSLKPVSNEEEGFFAFVAICQLPLISEYAETNNRRYKNPQTLIFSCRCSPINWQIFLVDCSVSTLPSISMDRFRGKSILEFIPPNERDYVDQQLFNSTMRMTNELITCHFNSSPTETLFMILQIKPMSNPVTKQAEFVELIFEYLLNLLDDIN